MGPPPAVPPVGLGGPGFAGAIQAMVLPGMFPPAKPIPPPAPAPAVVANGQAKAPMHGKALGPPPAAKAKGGPAKAKAGGVPKVIQKPKLNKKGHPVKAKVGKAKMQG